MAERLLIDTDVLIDFSRRRDDAAAFMRGLRARPAVCSVTIAELYAGVREGRERRDLERSPHFRSSLTSMPKRQSEPGYGSASIDPATAPAWPTR